MEFCILASSSSLNNINALLEQLHKGAQLRTGIEVANSILELLGELELQSADSVIDSNVLSMPNAERQDSWFHPHPWMRGERSAFELVDSNLLPIQAKFFWLQKKGTALVAGSVHFTKNWEDHDFTRTDDFKVGIDFFLTPNSNSLLIVLSNRGKLRVMEVAERLSNTQYEIFQNWTKFSENKDRESLHAALWESFKIHSVNNKFYEGVSNAFNELQVHLTSLGKNEEESKLFASRLMGRLIFVWFLRKMKMINEQIPYFEQLSLDQNNYYKNKLEFLFFNVLNTPITDRNEFQSHLIDSSTPYLNGGLFAARQDDWQTDENLTFPSNFFQRIFEHFSNFNFTTDESTPEYEQIAIDPEMLGRVFESLLASQVDVTGDLARKARGTFYTPREVVAYMCTESIRKFLENLDPNDARIKIAVSKLLDTSDQEWAIAGTNSIRDIPIDLRQRFSDALKNLRAIDPACGSGAFPLGLLQLLFKIQNRLEPKSDPYKLKLSILQNNIYGVDIEPMAVEISRLRAWLALVVDQDESRLEIKPLPNLDFKFVCANSLIELDSGNTLSLFDDDQLGEKLQDIREDYFKTQNIKKKNDLISKYRRLAQEEFTLFGNSLRTKQLKSFNPFDSHVVAEFFDSLQMFGVEKFDIVIANPPYIGEKGNKSTFRKIKESPLGKKYGQGKMDYFYYFFHLAIEIAKFNGVICFITTNYYPTATSAFLLRQEFKNHTNVIKLINFNELKIFKSAAGQHNMITLLVKGNPNPEQMVDTCVTNRQGEATASLLTTILNWSDSDTEYFKIPQSELYRGARLDIVMKSGRAVDAVLDALATSALKLKDAAKISEGLQTGANSVFVFNDVPEVLFGDEVIASDFIKPFLKNSDLLQFGTKPPKQKVLYLPPGIKIDNYPKILNYLKSHKDLLESRAQIVRSGQPWYQLLWPRDQKVFEMSPKIITPYRSKLNLFFYTEKTFYGGTDTYFIYSNNSQHLKALAAFLNSKLGLVWFKNIGKVKGQIMELTGDNIASFPLPTDFFNTDYKVLGDLVDKIEAIVEGTDHPEDAALLPSFNRVYEEIDDLVMKFYHLSEWDRSCIIEEHSKIIKKISE